MSNQVQMLEDHPKEARDIVIKGAKCSECMFFKNFRHPVIPGSCSSLGRKSYSKPCQLYKLDMYAIDTDKTKLLSQLLKSASAVELSLYARLCNQEPSTRKHGYRHGSTVYVRLYPADYISNYAKATIISADKEYVFAQGPNKLKAALYHSSVLSPEAWKSKKEQLLKKDKVIDPKLKSYTLFKVNKKKAVKKDYVVPTIDKYNSISKKFGVLLDDDSFKEMKAATKKAVKFKPKGALSNGGSIRVR